MYNVHFEPDNIDIAVESGTSLMEAAVAAGVHINASCGGAGVCGTCNVLIKSGDVESRRTDKISAADYEKGVRQSCQSEVLSDLVVEIPVESRLEKAVINREQSGIKSQTPAALVSGWDFNPPLKKLYLELSPPTMEDNSSDLSRLLRGIRQQYGFKDVSVEFNVVEKLADTLRQADWKVTASLFADECSCCRLVNIESGDVRAKHYSLAFDIGTTAVRGQLLDLNRGSVLAQAIDYNRQISYGEDVISRIAWSQKTGGLKKLQDAVTATLNDMIKTLAGQAGIETGDICNVVIAANTVMVQLLLNIDPRHLRLAPYVPTAASPPVVKASSLGIGLADYVPLYTLPSVASYVGGDIVAGILGTGIYKDEAVTLYIDIGTNGEIVAGNSEWLATASCSAGPTFEGGGIKHGMIAASGAIEGFRINPADLEPVITVIDNAKPKGICGSGIINMTAEMLRSGIIGQNGKFNMDLPTDRLRHGDDGNEYVVARADETQTGKDIVFTEIDMDNLIRSKAAMFAGCQTLIKSMGSRCAELDRLIIAGTFGSSLDIENAITIGLLPDIPRDRYIFVGNGSLLGARLTSFSEELLRDGQKIAAMMTNIELSENTDFMANYMAAMFLPHTHAELFPSVIINKGSKS